jgi:hypothetical protein
MMSGGLPQLSAPNMAGMAQGGIVGYQMGGAVTPAPTPTPVVPRPIPQGQPNAASQAAGADDVARFLYLYSQYQASRSAAQTPEAKAQVDDRWQQESRTFNPETIMSAMQKLDSQNNMAQGGVVGYTPGGSVRPLKEPRVLEKIADYFRSQAAAGNLTAEDLQRLHLTSPAAVEAVLQPPTTLEQPEIEEQVDLEPIYRAARRNLDIQDLLGDVSDARLPNIPFTLAGEETQREAPQREAPQREAPVAAPNPYNEGLSAIQKEIAKERAALDPAAAGTAAGARYRSVMGADDLVAQRAEAERQRRELAEGRFSPEEQRRRALRAGLAGLASRGLGGFSAGTAAEDDRIYAERTAESDRSIAEINRLTAEFRTMGLGEIEAENAARDLVQGRADSLRGDQADILKSQAGIADTEEQRRLQAEQMEIQKIVALIQANSSQFARSLDILTRAGLSEMEALTTIATMSQAAGADPLNGLWQKSVFDAVDRVYTDAMMMAKTPEEKAAAAAQIAQGTFNLVAQGAGAQSAVGGDTPSTEFGGVSDEDLLNFGN